MGGKAKTEKMSVMLRKQKIALEKRFGAWENENHPDLATPEDSTAYIRAIRKD